MKHYCVKNGQGKANDVDDVVPERTRHIDVILRCEKDNPSAEAIVDFYRSLNSLIGKQSYLVNVRVIADGNVGGPLYWARRTAILWGDSEHSWCPVDEQKTWIAQVLSLSPRALLVGGAVTLLAQIDNSDRKVAAVHSSFEAAAMEMGIEGCGATTLLSTSGRLHSANAHISAIRLLSDFVSIDHGAFLADALRRHIGLIEPKQSIESQFANRLIRKANGDELVILTLAIMLENIEEPLSISGLSEKVGTSIRQLQRRYLCKTGAKLLDTYKELRLERAISLLQHTDMPLMEVATATGFSSRAAMSRAFFKQYGSGLEASRQRRYCGTAPI
ncbi:helix-turn-helix domain-containing protein [Ruegeria arenilitoris]|uniref:helix-turn-helix domain-containing protein n=1 Tax=Ruegeria arenilitoris TaxID=1173585 RepID=UPI00147D018C|nr:helix-turn-helix domain-containing protein [Ruegeria arenilitoris]